MTTDGVNRAFVANRSSLEVVHVAPSARFPPTDGSWNHLVWELAGRAGGRHAVLAAADRVDAPVDDLEVPMVLHEAGRGGAAAEPLARRVVRRALGGVALGASARPRASSGIGARLAGLDLPAGCAVMIWEKQHLIQELRAELPATRLGFAQRGFPIPDLHDARPHRGLDLLVFQTAGQLDAVLRHEGSLDASVHVVPNGVELDRFRPPTGEERSAARRSLGIPDTARRVVLFASTLKAKKGIGVVRRLVEATGPDDGVHVVVAKGSKALTGVERTRADAFLAAVRDRPWVTCVDSVDRSMMPALYQASDLTVMPGLTLEGFSMVMLESMASGVPVVAPRIPTFDEVLDDRWAFLHPPADALATVLDVVLNAEDETLIERGRLARDVALERYDRGRVLEQFERALTDLA